MKKLLFFMSIFILICSVWTANAANNQTPFDTPTDEPEKTVAAPQEVVAPKEETVPVVKDEALEIWEMLLQNRLKEMAEVNVIIENFLKDFPKASKEFNAKLSKLNKEYEHTVTMASISRGLPLESSIILTDFTKLQNQLTILMGPLDNTLSIIKQRLEEIDLFEKDMPKPKDVSSAKLQTLITELNQTRSKLNTVNKRLNNLLLPGDRLKKNIITEKETLSKLLPELWQEYYLKRASRLYEPSSWKDIDFNWDMVKEGYAMRFKSELPQDPEAWGGVILRIIFFWLILNLAKIASCKLAQTWPPILCDGWLRMSKHSFKWIIWGIIFEILAWSQSSGTYHFFTIFGTLLLSLGQMALTWDLYTFERTDLQSRSPLWPLFIPLLGGLVLLLLNIPANVLACVWIVILIINLYWERKRSLPDIPFPLILHTLKMHIFIMYIALFMTLLGYGRLSILACMFYTAIVVCIQQAIGFMRLTNCISANLPQEGIKGLVWGGILALALPAVLILATLAICLWIFAYPGGTYLFTRITSLDISIGQTTFNFIQVLLIVSVFYVTKTIISVGKFFIKELPQRGVYLESNLIGPFQVIFTYTLWGFFALYTLSSLGFSLNNLAVVAGGLSVGIGFGLQNIINNFISGLLIIFGQTLREGDIIEVGQNLTGVVKKISIRSTMVETFDNATIFVPNSEFLSSRLTNWTRNGRMVRREIKVGVGYGSDVHKVIKILHEIATNHPKVLVYPEPTVVFANFGDSSLDFTLLYWIGDISSGLSIMTDLRLEVAKRFNEENIEISFPQLDVHFKPMANNVKTLCTSN